MRISAISMHSARAHTHMHCSCLLCLTLWPRTGHLALLWFCRAHTTHIQSQLQAHLRRASHSFLNPTAHLYTAPLHTEFLSMEQLPQPCPRPRPLPLAEVPLPPRAELRPLVPLCTWTHGCCCQYSGRAVYHKICRGRGVYVKDPCLLRHN